MLILLHFLIYLVNKEIMHKNVKLHLLMFFLLSLYGSIFSSEAQDYASYKIEDESAFINFSSSDQLINFYQQAVASKIIPWQHSSKVTLVVLEAIEDLKDQGARSPHFISPRYNHDFATKISKIYEEHRPAGVMRYVDELLEKEPDAVVKGALFLHAHFTVVLGWKR